MKQDILDLKTLKQYLAADLTANFNNRRSCAYKYLKWVRLCRYLYLKRSRLCKPLLKLAVWMKHRVGDRYGFDFLHTVPMGRGYHISHNIGVINMAKSAGDDLIFRNFVTVGVQRPGQAGPVIGDRVQFGTGCRVLGDITVGSDVLIGANAVVVRDVPDHSVVAGIPAKVIRRTKDRWGTPWEEPQAPTADLNTRS